MRVALQKQANCSSAAPDTAALPSFVLLALLAYGKKIKHQQTLSAVVSTNKRRPRKKGASARHGGLFQANFNEVASHPPISFDLQVNSLHQPSDFNISRIARAWCQTTGK